MIYSFSNLLTFCAIQKFVKNRKSHGPTRQPFLSNTSRAARASFAAWRCCRTDASPTPFHAACYQPPRASCRAFTFKSPMALSFLHYFPPSFYLPPWPKLPQVRVRTYPHPPPRAAIHLPGARRSREAAEPCTVGPGAALSPHLCW
jgi:hypothetical protein